MALEVTHLLLHFLQKIQHRIIIAHLDEYNDNNTHEAEQKITLLLSASRRKADVMGSQLYLGMEHVFSCIVIIVLIFPGQIAIWQLHVDMEAKPSEV